MKKTLFVIALSLAIVAGVHYAPPSGLEPGGWETPSVDAQASFTTTTLNGAITTPITNPGSSIPTQSVVLTSGTGVTTSTLLYVDRELMQVTSIANSPRFAVIRGVFGTIVSSHATLAPVRIGLPQYFGSTDKSGSCTATAEVINPYINVNNGAVFTCTNSVWVRGPYFNACGTVAACVPVNNTSTIKVVYGTVALGSASPSVATVTGISPAFASATSYVCTATPVGADATIAGNGVAITNVDGTSFTVTGPNTVTTVIDYVCVGT